MFANTIRIWKKNSPVTIFVWKSHKNLQLQREVCISARNKLYFNVNQNKNQISMNQTDWNKTISEAKKIVGYSSSLNLRLLNDEIGNIALDLRKLVGSNHPVLKTTK